LQDTIENSAGYKNKYSQLLQKYNEVCEDRNNLQKLNTNLQLKLNDLEKQYDRISKENEKQNLRVPLPEIELSDDVWTSFICIIQS
jgi:predicted nuclease with TOPRIM domain